MQYLSTVLQLVVALGILNVWLLRSGRATLFRGGAALNLQAEFAAYGLPVWSFVVIGVLKLSAAAMLLLGFVFPVLIRPASALLVVLMLGAVAMHAKVRDPVIRYLPAAAMLVMSLCLVFNA